jgi:prophage antirepressor-like protein
MNLSVFQYSGKEVRTTIIDGKPWFVAKDLCEILGIANVSHALSKLDDDERNTIVLNDGTAGNPTTSIVSESGMYALVLRSRKPEAKSFRKWVTSEVLPSISRTGSYSVTPQPQLPQTYLEALEVLVKVEKDRLILQAEKEMLEADSLALAEVVDELNNYSSILRVAKFNNVDEKLFRWQSLKAMSMKMGLEVKKVPCPRFEKKNLYHHDVWRYLYPKYSLPETTTITVVTKK